MQKTYPSIIGKGFTVVPQGDALVMSVDFVPQRWMKQANSRRAEPSLTANQLTSISAMIAYIAHNSGQSEFRVERRLADRFNVPNAKFLSADDFDKAIRYLADILPPTA